MLWADRMTFEKQILTIKLCKTLDEWIQRTGEHIALADCRARIFQIFRFGMSRFFSNNSNVYANLLNFLKKCSSFSDVKRISFHSFRCNRLKRKKCECTLWMHGAKCVASNIENLCHMPIIVINYRHFHFRFEKMLGERAPVCVMIWCSDKKKNTLLTFHDSHPRDPNSIVHRLLIQHSNKINTPWCVEIRNTVRGNNSYKFSNWLTVEQHHVHGTHDDYA